jgi:hypothetical protein
MSLPSSVDAILWIEDHEVPHRVEVNVEGVVGELSKPLLA